MAKLSMKPFVTGSYAYGFPHKNSDIDLVVLVTEEDLRRLQKMAGAQEHSDEEYANHGTRSLRFGKLNLLCCTDEHHFKIWKEGTWELKERAPVTRDEACEFLKNLRKTHEINNERWE